MLSYIVSSPCQSDGRNPAAKRYKVSLRARANIDNFHWKNQQAVVRKHNKPRPRVAHRGIARFLGIDQKCNRVIPWSLHTFPECFMQIGPAVFS